MNTKAFPRRSCVGPRRPRAQRHLLIPLVETILVFATTGPLFTQDLKPNQCYRADLSQNIQWATSGAWINDEQGKALLVVDTMRDDVFRISRISPDGRVVSGISEDTITALKGPASAPARYPTQLTMHDGEYWLLDDDQPARISRFHRSFESGRPPIWVEGRSLERPVSRKAGRDDAWQLMAVYQFTPMASGILAFGDRYGPKGWQSAFLYFDESGRSQVYHTIETTDTIRHHYLRTTQYLASIGEAGYALLVLEGELVIAEVRPETAELGRLGFPEDFQSWPRLGVSKAWRELMMLSPRLGARKERVFYEILEREPTVAAGLYAWRGSLYLLGRRKVEKEGRAAWWLIKLNPQNGAERFRVRLPTDAAHLIVVPGDFWAFIEKQAVQSVGESEAPYMRTDSMSLVPSAWIEESSNGRLTAKEKTSCVSLPNRPRPPRGAQNPVPE